MPDNTQDNLVFPDMNNEDKELFLKSFNKIGFILEDKVWKILSETAKIKMESWERGNIYDYQGERAEIDFIASTEKHDFIIECKKTDYSWVFAKALQRPDVLNLIFWEGGNVGYTLSKSTNHFKTAWTQIGISLDENEKLEKKNKDGRMELKTNREDYNDVNKNIRQSLKEVGAYLENIFPKTDKLIIPLIVTSADLYYLNYDKGDINERGDLINFSEIEKIKGLAFNFADFVKYKDKGDKSQINIQNIFENNQIKTVFIVNVNYLEEFMKEIIDETSKPFF